MDNLGSKISLFLDYDIMTDCYRLMISKKQGRKRYFAKLVFEETEGFTYHEPTLSFSEQDILHEMKQALNRLGMIDHADAGTLKAKDAHLEDLRKIVFKVKS